ncbi:MAG: hypothetical protein AAB971_00760 [Patescibacteria group bacterium]
MPNKKLNLKRRRFDAAYIFASVFAVFGGFALLGTYAAHNSPTTFSKGTYSLSQFATDEPNVFSFGIKQGMTYCFTSLAAGSNPQVTISNGEGVTQSFVLTQVTSEQACFAPNITHQKVKAKLPQSNPAPTSLTVQ